jgi:hypothetical protein
MIDTTPLPATMNETIWQSERDPLALLEALHPMRTLGSIRPQTRQSRMYLLACARRCWQRLPGVCRTLAALAEVYADAPNEEEPLRAAIAPIAEQLMNSDCELNDLLQSHLELTAIRDSFENNDEALSGLREPICTAVDPELRGLAALVHLPFEPNTPAFTWVPRPLHSRRLIHEVHCNPCGQVYFDANWRTDTAVSLARDMYDRREFSAMPILADALQDAGCDNEEVLNHCRDRRQIHVRGCWVLDLVLNLK